MCDYFLCIAAAVKYLRDQATEIGLQYQCIDVGEALDETMSSS